MSKQEKSTGTDRRESLTTARALHLRLELFRAWQQDLELDGVKYPLGLAIEPALLALFEATPKALTHEEIAQFYLENSTLRYDRQARHLATDGWDLRSGHKRYTQGERDGKIKSDQLRLASVATPNPIWLISDRLKRTGSISALNWKEKLAIYRKRGCAVCGQRFRHYDKGHLDPDLGAVDSNIVPMCTNCNNWAGDRAKFKLYELIARVQELR